MTRWTLVVAFHVSSVHKLYNQWWMACRFTLTQRVLPQGVKFPYPLSTWHLIHSHHCQVRIPIKYPQKNVHVPDHIHDQKMSTEARVLPKRKVDDRASSKTHLVRFMHNVLTSKFKIFSVAKARCWNTRLSPKTPKVFPVLNSSSKIQFLG